MTNTLFRQTLIISLLGHFTLFSIFGFSFGPRIPQADFTQAYFRGAILRDADLSRIPPVRKIDATMQFMGKAQTLVLDRAGNKDFLFDARGYLKPHTVLASDIEKPMPKEAIISIPPVLQRKESSVMFYPKLPYYLSLYFKDRQVAHIEIMFEVSSSKEGNSILIKRKVSSGNLEVDLLSMRYLGHYLFIQKTAFSPDDWHTVKIDLSTLND